MKSIKYFQFHFNNDIICLFFYDESLMLYNKSVYHCYFILFILQFIKKANNGSLSSDLFCIVNKKVALFSLNFYTNSNSNENIN